MSAVNGERIIKIGRKGIRKIALGDGEPVAIDVVATQAMYSELDRSFRDDKGEIPKERIMELNMALWKFATDHVRSPSDPNPTLSFAEALEFLKVITEEADALKDFFVPSTRKEQSSPESTELRFST